MMTLMKEKLLDWGVIRLIWFSYELKPQTAFFCSKLEAHSSQLTAYSFFWFNICGVTSINVSPPKKSIYGYKHRSNYHKMGSRPCTQRNSVQSKASNDHHGYRLFQKI